MEVVLAAACPGVLIWCSRDAIHAAGRRPVGYEREIGSQLWMLQLRIEHCVPALLLLMLLRCVHIIPFSVHAGDLSAVSSTEETLMLMLMSNNLCYRTLLHAMKWKISVFCRTHKKSQLLASTADSEASTKHLSKAHVGRARAGGRAWY